MNPTPHQPPFGRTRLQVATGAAVLAVVARTAAALTEPDGAEGSTRQMLAAYASHPRLGYASIWAEMLAYAAAALACATVTGLVPPGPGRRLALVGGWATTTSFLCLGFFTAGMAQVAFAQMADHNAAIAANHALESSPGLVPVFVLLALGLVTPVLQAIGLARARLVGWWFAAAAVLQGALFIVLGGEHTRALNLVGLVPQLAVFAGYGLICTSFWTTSRPSSSSQSSTPAATPNRASTRSDATTQPSSAPA